MQACVILHMCLLPRRLVFSRAAQSGQVSLSLQRLPGKVVCSKAPPPASPFAPHGAALSGVVPMSSGAGPVAATATTAGSGAAMPLDTAAACTEPEQVSGCVRQQAHAHICLFSLLSFQRLDLCPIAIGS